MNHALWLAGLVVGLLVGMTGIGGGALMTPFLILIHGTAPQPAVATDLLFAATTKIAGMGIHGRHGSIDWQIAGRLASGSLPAAAVVGLTLYLSGVGTPATNHIVLQALGGMLIVTAIGMLLAGRLHALGQDFRRRRTQCLEAYQVPLTTFAGVLLGTAVTLTSVGAGAFGAMLLLYLYPLRLSAAKLVGTDIAHAIPLALVAGISHIAMGNVDFPLLVNLLAGSIPGVLVGAWWSSKASNRILRPAIAIALAASGLKILGG